MHTLANSEGPDEIQHNVTFHQDLHCLLRRKRSLEKEMQFYLEGLTCDPLNYTSDHSKIIASNQKADFTIKFSPLVHKGLQ